MENEIDKLETLLDYAKSSFDNLKDEVKEVLADRDQIITEYVKEIEQLEEQNELLEEQVQDLTYQNAMLEIELSENTTELIQMRHELGILRKEI
jgi:organic radical activating enzyme